MRVEDTMADSAKSARLADRALRDALVRFVRTKVSDADVDDVVQATLTDAVGAERSPDDPEELRKWVFGIARHKVADHFRGARREGARESTSSVEAAADSAPLSAKDLLRWAERELPAGDKDEGTLEWMLREGDGEKLEHIADEEKVDAARVRQRVSRLRRYFRERWAAQLAAVAAVLVMIGAAWWLWRQRPTPDEHIVHVPPSAEPSPIERAQQLRRAAFDQCAKQAWTPCVEGLDEAAKLDPAGDLQDDVQQARRRAKDAISPPAPSATPAPSAPPAPSSSAPKPVRTTAPIPTDSPKKTTSSEWDSMGPTKDSKAPAPRPFEGSK